MGTSNWHLLDNLCTELRRIGGVLNEMTHKWVREDSLTTSKITGSSMYETTRKREEGILQCLNVYNKYMDTNI